jgi:hypothetical protein
MTTPFFVQISFSGTSFLRIRPPRRSGRDETRSSPDQHQSCGPRARKSREAA